jgi:hypothetical protein
MFAWHRHVLHVRSAREFAQSAGDSLCFHDHVILQICIQPTCDGEVDGAVQSGQQNRKSSNPPKHWLTGAPTRSGTPDSGRAAKRNSWWVADGNSDIVDYKTAFDVGYKILARHEKIDQSKARATRHAPEVITREGGATIADIMAATGWQKHYADIGIRPTPSAAS